MLAWDASKPISAQPSATLEVNCERCARRGKYAVFRLYAAFGDRLGPELLLAIAARAGCDRAKSPPSANDNRYSDNVCQIRVILPKPPYVSRPTIYSRMHEGWRLFIQCGRTHQGLKSTKPCPGEMRQLHLRTLVASLGHDCLVEDLEQKLVTPCCQSRQFELHWYQPHVERGGK